MFTFYHGTTNPKALLESIKSGDMDGTHFTQDINVAKYYANGGYVFKITSTSTLDHAHCGLIHKDGNTNKGIPATAIEFVLNTAAAVDQFNTALTAVDVEWQQAQGQWINKI